MSEKIQVSTGARWTKASLFSGVGALLFVTAVFGVSCLNFRGNFVGFWTVVYAFLAMGFIAYAGLVFSIVAFFKKERCIGLAIAALVLNILLAAVGSCFVVIILPK